MGRTGSLVASMLIIISCLAAADLMSMLPGGCCPWCLAMERRRRVIFLSPFLENHIPYAPKQPLNCLKEVYLLADITINNLDSFKSAANDMIHCGAHLLYVGRRAKCYLFRVTYGQMRFTV